MEGSIENIASRERTSDDISEEEPSVERLELYETRR